MPRSLGLLRYLLLILVVWLYAGPVYGQDDTPAPPAPVDTPAPATTEPPAPAVSEIPAPVATPAATPPPPAASVTPAPSATTAQPASTSKTPTSTSPAAYVSTSEPYCSDSVTRSLIKLFGKNRNIFEQCTLDSQQYVFMPYNGTLPSTEQIRAMINSSACLEFWQGILSLPSFPECNLSGIDLKSAIETLVMTSQDVVNQIQPLSMTQYKDFIVWRHKRNVAKESGLKYDNTSTSALEFDTALAAAAARLEVTLTADLVIQVKGEAIGSSESILEGSLTGSAESASAPRLIGSSLLASAVVLLAIALW
ncbi:hypothetical protein Poli38472_000300 [Pythium oligandrum]|uniref:Uncharacterized protein n=1 Tax=Pythium oligandrum TaxID=41045 RepID=A0A8K1CC27_PYTOL|nr:hypothetical protein Poli38472_000300 [Pythium oligandrum]|eukprot:TMW60258.1 hypothetical protein Poli38472_000300 [Pythium oligandrum]